MDLIEAIQWNLLRKHAKAIFKLKQSGDFDIIQEDKGEFYANLFSQGTVQVKDLLLFQDWLGIGDIEEEVSTFILSDGLTMLSEHLKQATEEAIAKFDFNK